MTKPAINPMSQRVMERMRSLRKERGWSVRHLADLLAPKGLPINQAIISNIEYGRRDHITVDELHALAEVFGVSVDFLARPPKCETCIDSPPAGFTCNDCGSTGVRP